MAKRLYEIERLLGSSREAAWAYCQRIRAMVPAKSNISSRDIAKALQAVVGFP
jgi:hypothetical protein